MLSHELRSPLAPIYNAVQILRLQAVEQHDFPPDDGEVMIDDVPLAIHQGVDRAALRFLRRDLESLVKGLVGGCSSIYASMSKGSVTVILAVEMRAPGKFKLTKNS